MMLLTEIAIAETRFCVWDPIGRGGGITRIASGLQPFLLKQAVTIDVQSFADEQVAVAAFKDQQCDLALLPANVIYDMHPFVTSLSAVGGIRNLEELDLLLATLASPKAAPLFSGPTTEVAGLLPSGSIYAFLRDREAYRIEDLQGKKFAVMAYDPISAELIRRIGGSPVGATLYSFAGLFNSGSVDVAYAPALAYGPLELYKGIGETGGIVRYPWLQGFLTLVIRPDALPEGLGQALRTQVDSHRQEALTLIANAEELVPASNWIDVSAKEVTEIERSLAEIRGELKDRKIYHPKALAIMKKVRCKTRPEHAECSSSGV